MSLYATLRNYCLYAALGVGALSGCGKEENIPKYKPNFQSTTSLVPLEKKVAEIDKEEKELSHELDLSTPEKAGDAYLAAYDNADYDKLLQMTTGNLNRAFNKSNKEQVIKTLRDSALKNGTATGNVINRFIIYGPASKDRLRKVRDLKADEAEVQYSFNNRFGGFDGNGRLNKSTLRLRHVGNSWVVYDQ